MTGELRVGDEVRYRTSWGFGPEAALPATVVGIERNERPLDALPWDIVCGPFESVFVDLDNGTWAYGDQLVAPNERRSSR